MSLDSPPPSWRSAASLTAPNTPPAANSCELGLQGVLAPGMAIQFPGDEQHVIEPHGDGV